MQKYGGKISTLAAWALLLLSLSLFFPIEKVWFWKFSIVLSEFAHVFAFLCLAIAIQIHSWPKRAVLAAAGVIYLSPILQMSANMPYWQYQLSTFIGETTITPQYSRLVWGGFALSNKHEELLVPGAGGNQLKIQFYRGRPETPGAAPAPLVLMIPGGSWASVDTEILWEMNAYLADRGYAVAVIPYRVAPEFRWPSQRDDVEAAIAFLRAQSGSLNIDMNRWVIFGRSAGGQLAESIAFAGNQPGLRGGIYLYAPSDLNFAYGIAREDDIIQSPQLLRNYLGGSPKEREIAYTEASPLDYVSTSSPPALLIHGMRDPLVWTVHSQRLFAKLIEKKVPAAFIEIPWATHGFDYVFAGPGSVVANFAIENFLHKVLTK